MYAAQPVSYGYDNPSPALYSQNVINYAMDDGNQWDHTAAGDSTW